jgi:hypothetical protein
MQTKRSVSLLRLITQSVCVFFLCFHFTFGLFCRLVKKAPFFLSPLILFLFEILNFSQGVFHGTFITIVIVLFLLLLRVPFLVAAFEKERISSGVRDALDKRHGSGQ